MAWFKKRVYTQFVGFVFFLFILFSPFSSAFGYSVTISADCTFSGATPGSDALAEVRFILGGYGNPGLVTLSTNISFLQIVPTTQIIYYLPARVDAANSIHAAAFWDWSGTLFISDIELNCLPFIDPPSYFMLMGLAGALSAGLLFYGIHSAFLN